MDYNISNRNHTQEILKKHGFSFKKSLGQNFLIDSNILDKIVKKAGISKETAVIEIGPGIGALTQKLAEAAGKVVAIELDQRLIPILSETLSFYDNVEIVNHDVLKVSLKEMIESKLSEYKDVKIVANLPYYITSAIIIKVLEEKLPISSITVMVQKEVAERISAKPGGKEYGSLTLFINYFTNAKIAFTVPSTVFMPRPNVDSAILQLTLKEKGIYNVKDEKLLFKIIRSAFQHRRKTLYNNLVTWFGKENKEKVQDVLNSQGIDGSRRAETLNLDEFINLSNAFKAFM